MFEKNPYELYNGDCLEIMKGIEDKSVDMILCDLPYGNKTTACRWDTIIPFDKMWEQYNRIIKDGGAIALFGQEPFSSALRMSNIKNYKHEWYWNKEVAGNFIQAKNHPLKVIENVIVFSNSKVNYSPIMEEAKEKNKRPRGQTYNQKSDFLGTVSNGEFKTSETHNEDLRYPKNLITFNARVGDCNNVNRVHPTQKPTEILEYLIKTYTKDSEIVLDNTMGSGSTGVACMNINRNFIGIELDNTYFEIAKNRISNTYNELNKEVEE